MKVAAAHALSAMVKEPSRGRILPAALNRKVAREVAAAVQAAAREGGHAIAIG